MIPISQQDNFYPVLESKAWQDDGHNGLALQTDPMFENMQQTGKSLVRMKCIFVSPKIVLSTKRILLFNGFINTKLLRLQNEHLNKEVILFRLKTFNYVKSSNRDSNICVTSLWSSIIWIRCGKHLKLCLCNLLIFLKLISKNFILLLWIAWKKLQDTIMSGN